jgi:tryptophan-rich sensory protein
MKQPMLGVVATGLMMALSLGFIALLDFPTFAGWVSYSILCIIPMQIVIGVIWGPDRPAFIARRPQPVKGTTLALFALAAGAVVAPVHYLLAGATVSPPAPMLMHVMIVSVPVTFWAAIMFGGWPFKALISNPVKAGITMLATSYVVNYALFRILFDYSFMQGAPVYVASLDPHGFFNAVNALVVYVTALSVMFLMLSFDLWPLVKTPALMRQPILGIVWTVIALTIGIAGFLIGTSILHMDPMAFLVAVPVPLIFGSIVVLNMLQNSVFGGLTQPLKGVANVASVVIIGELLALAYRAVEPLTSGALAAGPPAYDLEIWIASALLAVTFPFLIFFAEFFKFWPLTKPE